MTRTHFGLALFLAVVTTAAATSAQSPTGLTRKVEEYLQPIVASGDLNGVVLIARGDSVIFERAYGKADWDLSVPLSVRSRFRIASITKTFTAAAVSMLAEEGKLSYADPLSKFIPNFPNGDRIKIRHLLLHQSGVSDPSASTCGTATLDELVAEIARQPLNFEPGTRDRYSNGGYVLLGRVIEVASGMPWATFLADRIFQPLGLVSTSVDSRAIVPNRVRGFVPGPGSAGVEHALCEGAWGAIGSGAIVSDATDLYRWGKAVRADKPFKRTALEYPYGWGKRKYFDRAAIEQSGILNGFSSYLAVYPADNLYIVVLSNVQTGMLIDVGKGLAALAVGRQPPKLSPSPAYVERPAAERAHWLGHFGNPSIANIEITAAGGGMRLRWADSPETVFIAPTGPSTAYDREDSIAMTLSADGSVITMRWSGGDVAEFKRLP